MKNILICEDRGHHNLKYYYPFIELFKDDFNFTFARDEDQKRLDYINQFDLVLTSNASFRHFIEVMPAVKTRFLSWNHSMLGPCKFNDYHLNLQKKVQEKYQSSEMNSKIFTMIPSHYKTIVDQSGINVIYSDFYYRLLFIKNYPKRRLNVRETSFSYINHWSSNPESVLDYISLMKNTGEYYVSLHPSYHLYEVEDYNPLKVFGNCDSTLISNCLGVTKDINRGFTYNNIFDLTDSSKVIAIDRRTGSIPEILLRMILTESDDILIRLTDFESISNTHDETDYRYIDSLYNLTSNCEYINMNYLKKMFKIDDSFWSSDNSFNHHFKSYYLNLFKMILST